MRIRSACKFGTRHLTTSLRSLRGSTPQRPPGDFSGDARLARLVALLLFLGVLLRGEPMERTAVRGLTSGARGLLGTFTDRVFLETVRGLA